MPITKEEAPSIIMAAAILLASGYDSGQDKPEPNRVKRAVRQAIRIRDSVEEEVSP